MCNPVIFSKSTKLCNQRHRPVLEHSHHPNKSFLPILQLLPCLLLKGFKSGGGIVRRAFGGNFSRVSSELCGKKVDRRLARLVVGTSETSFSLASVDCVQQGDCAGSHREHVNKWKHAAVFQ